MNTVLKILPLFGALALITACEDSDKDSSSPEITMIKEGDFQLIDGNEVGDELEDFHAKAQLIITESNSMVEVTVSGLPASSEFPVHLHRQSCDDSNGGGHYLQDQDGEDLAENGLWPMVSSDSEGVGYGVASQEFVVREADSLSVVIHDNTEDKDKMACADLVMSEAYTGDFSITEAGEAAYPDGISGSATVVVQNTAGDEVSKALVIAQGLEEQLEYGSHVHVDECSTGGGSHYLQDVEEEDEAWNGLWPTVTDVNTVFGIGWAWNDFGVRFADANSVVIHESGDSARIACADLSEELLVYRSGSFTDWNDSGYSGRATLAVDSEGDTTVRVYLAGAMSETEHKIHVHNAPCNIGQGQGHYLHNLDGEDNAGNGFWPFVTTDVNGVGMAWVTQSWTARPDAQSVVIHDPDDSSVRLACANLD